MWSFGTRSGPLFFALLAVGCGTTVVTGTGTSGTGGSTSSSGGTGGASTGGGGTGASTGGGGTGGGGAPTGGGGTGGAAGCQSDDDCQSVPGAPLCDLLTGKCVGCTWDGDCLNSPGGSLCDPLTSKCVACFVDPDPATDCGVGEWCDPTGQCVIGCTGDEDCPSPEALVCDMASHTCVGCTGDGGCPPGSICAGAQCVPGCNVNQPCQAGLSCCGNTCLDLDNDVANCGFCNSACSAPPHAEAACSGGMCQQAFCDAGYADCDLQSANGCERNLFADGPCVCLPGMVESCYSGAPGTAGVGVCVSGVRMCDPSGVSWGPCDGQVLPSAEICANGKDDDCNGQIDDDLDIDGDGWGACDGDCDNKDPAVNPGALELTGIFVDDDNDPATPPVFMDGVGNGKDDDCNPATVDMAVPPSCSAGAKSSGVTALDLAQALDLCQTAVLGAPKPQKTWGLLSATLLAPDGTAPSPGRLSDMQDLQTAVLASFGADGPREGPTFVGLSTGKMRVPGQSGYVPPSPGTDLGWAGSPPSKYLAAHGGSLPAAPACSGNCPGGTGANDGVLLRLQIRAPTNTNRIQLDYRFLTAEYGAPAACGNRDDFFLALIGPAAPWGAQDANIAFDDQGHPLAALHANLTACASPAGCASCALGLGPLAGTGMPASTSWLTTQMGVSLGQEMTLDLMVFDVDDGLGDSAVLLDHVWFLQGSNQVP